MKEIVVLAFDNCLTSSVVGLLDVFEIGNNFWKRHSATEQKLFNVTLATVNGEAIRSFNNLPIAPTVAIAGIRGADFIIIPPVMSDIDNAVASNAALIPWLKQFHKRGSVLASVCTGIFFLGETGLLDGKTVTTNPLMAAYFQQRYPEVKIDTERVLIDSGCIVTSGPTYAFVDLVIYILEKYAGSNVALQCSKLLLHDKNRTSQLPYLISPINKVHTDDGVSRIQAWLKENSAKALTVETIAEKFHMSTRNLVRRFSNATGETPNTYLQRLRVDAAKTKLEKTRMNFDQITAGVGYTDSKSFSRLFKRYTDLSPAEYRKRFSSRMI